MEGEESHEENWHKKSSSSSIGVFHCSGSFFVRMAVNANVLFGFRGLNKI